MRQKDDGRAATVDRPATPGVAPRFTRAAQAERTRLEGRREQLLRKREAAQAAVAEIDRAVGGVDELLELLAPLLVGNGSETEEAASEDGTTGSDRSAPGSEREAQPQPAKE
jgi:hypothetical protein